MRHLFTSFFATFSFFTFSAYCQCPVNDFAIVSSSIFCFNSASATVTASQTIVGRSYQAFEGLIPVGSPAVSTGGNLTLQIPLGSNFGIGNHIVYLKSKETGCPDINTSDTANVIVNQLPWIDLLAIGDTVCGNPNGSIIIKNSESGVIYVAYIGSVLVAGPIMGTGGDIYIQIGNLQPGNNTIHFTASRKGCSTVNLINTANLTVMPYVDIFYSVVGDTICQGSDAKVKVKYSVPGLLFEAYIGVNKIGPGIVSDGKDFEFLIPSATLMAGPGNTITVIPRPKLPKGCAGIMIQQTANIRVNVSPEFLLSVTGDTVTIDDEYAEITIKPTYTGVSYKLSENNVSLGTVVANNDESINYKIPVGVGTGKLSMGNHKIEISFSAYGCNNKTYKDTATVLVKPSVLLNTNNDYKFSEFKVWPNPFSSELHIELINPSGLVLLSLSNSLGTKIYEKEFNASESIVLYPDMPNGVYYLEIITGSSKKRIKVVK